MYIKCSPRKGIERQNKMTTTIQKNKTTILRTNAPSEGFVVATITAGVGLSRDLQSSTGERRSELLVHGRVFKTFRHPQLFKLFTDIEAAGEINTDHWRRPTQEGGDWFLLKEWSSLQAKNWFADLEGKEDWCFGPEVDENKEILLAIHGN
jgi:hypothetical protein